MSFSAKMMNLGMRKVYDYLEKDPKTNLPKLMEMIDKVLPESIYAPQRKVFREILENQDNNWFELIESVWTDIDPQIIRKFFENFIMNANLDWAEKREKVMEEYHCNVPWAILLDPTSACNMHCTGCWAAEYGNRLNLSFDEIDSIITQGKELGVYMYIYTGGEPLMRKQDLIALCNKHSDCEFLAFTNATLIDEEFADEMLRVKNFIPAISLEGFEAATDGRRGNGVFEKATHATKLLQAKHLPFGISACSTSANIDSIASDAYIDFICGLGARFIWYFHYMPVGNDAAPQLLPNPEQREYMYHRIREIRATKPIFAMDFQNDGEYVGGCIAGGRRYLHINANGDVDPCVFIHYSNANIRSGTLLEALQSPIFMAYHDGQPFNDNHLRPCPMLENPQILREIVEKTGAHSTDPQSPETADHLCAKCDEYAKNWQPTAERLWACSHDCSTCGAGCGKKD